MEQIDLFTLQNKIKSGMAQLFPTPVWVKAEISSMKIRSGHCYLELSQTENGKLKAKSNAIIWASSYNLIANTFYKATGTTLEEGLQVLVSVQVNFSELYGYSLIIKDINPEFTIGEKEAEKQKTIEKLNSENLMQRQRTLSMPELPYKLAVISAGNAAGLRDFEKHLLENEYGYVLSITLYEAIMQGKESANSIKTRIEYINTLLSEHYEAILILRGGGAKLDLATYDDYELCKAVALSDIPVLTAVGHDQDYHVCDMVAYNYLKTPTALADYFIDFYIGVDSRIQELQKRLKYGFSNKINAISSKLDLYEARIKGADPRVILKRGYVLALDSNGVMFKSVANVNKGDNIKLMLADGSLDCEIKKINK